MAKKLLPSLVLSLPTKPDAQSPPSLVPCHPEIFLTVLSSCIAVLLLFAVAVITDQVSINAMFLTILLSALALWLAWRELAVSRRLVQLMHAGKDRLLTVHLQGDAVLVAQVTWRAFHRLGPLLWFRLAVPNEASPRWLPVRYASVFFWVKQGHFGLEANAANEWARRWHTLMRMDAQVNRPYASE